MSALWDNTPTTYTSFVPLQSDVQSSGNIISRFLRRGRDDSSQSSADSSRTSSREVSVDRSSSASREQSAVRELSLDRDDPKTRTPEKSAVPRVTSSSEITKSGQWDMDKNGKYEETSSQEDQATKRTLSSVITRLSAILERRTATPQVYRDSDFKQFWMPDSSCKECYECGDKFTTFRRRHHCRICGQIFCNACCSQELPGKTIGYKGSIRVCIYCHRIANKYAQHADPSADPKVTREVLHKYLSGDGALSPDQGNKGIRRSTMDTQYSLTLRSPSDSDPNLDSTAPFDLTPQAEFISSENWDSERRLLIQDSSQLRNLWTLMIDPDKGLQFQSYRIRLRTYQKCIAGNKLVDWLLKQDKASNRVQAVAIGQALIDADYLDPTHNITTPFRDDFALYRPNEMMLSDQTDVDLDSQEDITLEDNAPLWFQEIQSNASHNDGDGAGITPDMESSDICSTISELSHDSLGRIRISERHFDDPLPQQNMLGSVDVSEPIFEDVIAETESKTENQSSRWQTLDISSDDTVEKDAFDKLQLEHHEHLTTLTKQLLHEEGLPPSWADIIISTVDRVSLFVKPDVRNNSDDMDIRRYVHIKKIPGGKREQTSLVHGVIFKKNIAHKKMAHNISNPSVLLLSGSIEYQRVENKMSSLQPQILQEEEYLHKVIGKIVAQKPKPDVLVVEKSVSRLAQDYLLKKGITLVYNVKQSVMDRLSRFLDTDIMRSVDSLMAGVRLGFCHTFCVRNFMLPSGESKTMLYFDGCATHLGCAVTLCGGSAVELKKVKKIMKFMIYASYHSRMEISFCMDEFLMPPAKQELDFDLEGQDLFKQSNKSTKDRLAKSDVDKTNASAETKPENKTVLVSREDLETEKIASDTAKSVESSAESEVASNVPRQTEDMSTISGQAVQGHDSGATEIDALTGTDHTSDKEVADKNAPENKTELDIARRSKQSGGQDKSESSGERISSFIRIEVSDDTTADMIAEEIAKGEEKDFDANFKGAESENDSADVPQVNCAARTGQTSISGSPLKTAQDRHTPAQDKSVKTHETGDRKETPSGDEVDVVNRKPSLDNKTQVEAQPTMTGSDGEANLRKKERGSSVFKADKSPGQQRKSATIQLTDHSDPLHNYQISQDESIFQANLPLEEELLSHRFKFKKALDNVAISVGPYIKFDLPYLETEAGSKCELRKYFPEEIYWSNHFCAKPTQGRAKQKYPEYFPMKKLEPPSNIQITEAHEFVCCQLLNSARHLSTKYLLANFRAYGGRIHILDIADQPKQPRPKFDLGKGGKDRSSGETTLADSSGKETVSFWERKTDCLDPYKHQRIAVLFSSYSYESENHPSPCVYPWVVTMEFYGKNDITLGGFLERFCFRPSYVCPSDSCNTSMVKHIRRFVHGYGSISIVLKKLEHPIPGGQQSILIWSWCHKCKQVTPVIPMSSDTWHMSFAKYLELRFHGKQFHRRASFEPCLHSLHHDHFQYFGFRDTVASFKYMSIKLKEIKLSPMVIDYSPTMEVITLYRNRDEVKRMTNKITDLCSIALEYLTKMKADCVCEHLVRAINDSVTAQQTEKTLMRDLAHTIREKIISMIKPEEDRKIIVPDREQRQTFGEIDDGIIMLKRAIAEFVCRWNVKLQDLYVQQKKSKQTSGSKKEKDAINIPDPATQDTESGKPKPPEADIPTISPSAISEEVFSMSGSDYDSEVRRRSDFACISISPPIRKVRSAVSLDSYTYGVTPGISAAGLGGLSSPYSSLPSDSYIVYDIDEVPSTEELVIAGEIHDNAPVSMATSMPDKNQPSSSAASDKGQKMSTSSNVSEKSLRNFCENKGDHSDTVSVETVVAKELVDDQPDSGDKIGSIKKTIMNTIWQGSGAYQLQMPFELYEHYLLPPCERLPVVVYDHEPSSIIAYSLSCHDYEQKLQEIQASFNPSQRNISELEVVEDNPPISKKPSSSKLSFFKGNGKEAAELADSVRYIPKSDNGLLESPDADAVDYTMYTSTPEVPDKSKTSKPPPSPHIELQFSDNTARFYCKVYFAEQFRQMRRHVFPDGEEMFIRSLSRCKPWEAKGGKSGSSFCKTDDDRFILKQMSYMEVESFEKFGPQYFQYIVHAQKNQRPVALAKIVGVYRIGFRNQNTNNAMKQDLLVMENLFYNRVITQKFDLKGSERNRMVKPNSKRGEEVVLMDENFLRSSVDYPLYILPHSKTMLTMAISHDTQFLSTNLVMDYSLLVGLDEQNKELVVGIIDYIRTFTWDKKLETIIKTNFGGQGKMPTVVSPEVYRNRFLDAMAKYFLQVPDQWTGLGNSVETS